MKDTMEMGKVMSRVADVGSDFVGNKVRSLARFEISMNSSA